MIAVLRLYLDEGWRPKDMPTVRCFVVGCSRSGTTLLSVMLDRHSQLAMTPETGFYGEIAPRLAETGPTELERHLSQWSRLPELGLEPNAVVDHCGANRAPGQVFEVILRL